MEYWAATWKSRCNCRHNSSEGKQAGTKCREGATVPGPSGIRAKVQINVGGGNGQGLSENKKPKDDSVKSEKLSLSRPPSRSL